MSRTLKNTFKNIRRAPYQALAAILVLTLTFFITQVFVMISLGSEKVIQYFETRPQVTAFFQDDINEDSILQLKSELEKLAYVSSVTYISKDEALKIYREQNKEDPLLLEMVTADILPASIEVSARSIDDLARVKADLEQTRGVEEIVYHQDIIEALRRWTNGIRTGGLVLIGFLVVTSLLVLTIIISMKVATKRQEIATMKLLGARSWYINGPFLTEGALYGLMASIISWGILYTILLYATPVLLTFFGDIPILPVPVEVMLAILGGTGAFAIFIGMISGVVSSRRFGH